MVLSGLGAAAVLGLDTNQTMAYQVFTLLLSLLVLSTVCGVFFRARFTVSRTMPRFGTVGEPLSYRLVVHNQTKTTQRGLVLLENVVDPRPSFEEFVHTAEPGEERRNWFDRTVGYRRWMWLIAKNRTAAMAEQPLPSLPPQGAGEVRLDIVPLQRGHLRLTGVTIARPDPFGMFRAVVTVAAPQSVLVLPKRYALPRIQLPGTRKYQQGGVALTSSVGDSEEFVSLRDYRPGDPLRRIHWKSWPKVGKLIVKEYQDEFFVRHALILDTFATTEQSEIFEEAVSVAASFACSLETQESLLDLMFVGPQAYCFTAGRGLGHTDKMLEILACVQVCSDQPFLTLHHLVVARHSALSGCICVLLAWDEARQTFISHLQTLGVPTLVLVITDARLLHPLAPRPMQEHLGRFHRLEMGKIATGLAQL